MEVSVYEARITGNGGGIEPTKMTVSFSGQLDTNVESFEKRALN